MKPLKRIFTTASATFGTIPGLAVLLTGLGTPPGRRVLFAAVVEVTGVFFLLLVWSNQPLIERWSRKRATRVLIWLFVTGVGALLLYIVLFNVYIVSLAGRETVVFPLWSTGDLADIVSTAGERSQAVIRYGAGAISEAAAAMPIVTALTIITLLLVYQTIFTAFTVAFGVAGIRQK